jgi:hypothetical protein
LSFCLTDSGLLCQTISADICWTKLIHFPEQRESLAARRTARKDLVRRPLDNHLDSLRRDYSSLVGQRKGTNRS